MEASLLVAPMPTMPARGPAAVRRWRWRCLVVVAATTATTTKAAAAAAAAATCTALALPCHAAPSVSSAGGGPLDIITFTDLCRTAAVLGDLDPATARAVAGVAGPALSALGFLFIARIVMSWYPRLPVTEFPYVVAYAPTEPLLAVTRRVIPPLGGVDVTPVVCSASSASSTRSSSDHRACSSCSRSSSSSLAS